MCGEATQAQEEGDSDGVAEGLGAATGEVPAPKDSPGLFVLYFEILSITLVSQKTAQQFK